MPPPLAVRFPLRLGRAAEFVVGFRRDELDAAGNDELDLLVEGHQRQPPFALEPGGQEDGLDGRCRSCDVLESRLARTAVIRRDERLDLGGRGRTALVGDRVVEIRVVGRAREGGEERADPLDVTAQRSLVAERVLDLPGQCGLGHESSIPVRTSG